MVLRNMILGDEVTEIFVFNVFNAGVKKVALACQAQMFFIDTDGAVISGATFHWVEWEKTES